MLWSEFGQLVGQKKGLEDLTLWLWGTEMGTLHIFINYRQQQKNELMYHQTKGVINGQKNNH